LQTLCQACWEQKYANPGPPKPWLPKGLPRLSRGNLFGFLFVFAFAFLRCRFGYDPPTTNTSAIIAFVLASIAIYLSGER
jgi:hypothetical protein